MNLPGKDHTYKAQLSWGNKKKKKNNKKIKKKNKKIKIKKKQI